MGLGKEYEGLELVENNTGYFHMEAHETSDGGIKQSVDVNPGKLPGVFKDKQGSPLFTAPSIGLGVEGKNTYNGPSFRPANQLPPIPEWNMSNADMPSPGEFHKIPGDNPSLLIGANAAKEIYNYKSLYNSVKVWTGYADLVTQVTAFDKATKVNMPFLGIVFTDAQIKRADYTNFVFDGSLPSFDPKLTVEGNILRNINFIEVGMQILRDNNIPIHEATTKTYENNKKDYLNLHVYKFTPTDVGH